MHLASGRVNQLGMFAGWHELPGQPGSLGRGYKEQGFAAVVSPWTLCSARAWLSTAH